MKKFKLAFTVGKQDRANPFAANLHRPDEDKVNWYTYK